MRVLVVTTWCDRYKGIADVSLPNLFAYCDLHSYLPAVIKLDESEGFHYKKHEFFKEALGGHSHIIFYKDIDTKITNLSIPIESFIDDEHDLFITKDFGGINGGSLILKNTEGGRRVNYFILSQRNEFNNEQEVIDHFINDPAFSPFVKILPHPSINSYPYEHYKEFKDVTHEQGQWQEGDFLIHTPALELSKRAEILKNAKVIK